MTAKSNIRSIRISDEMAELIDRQAGHNFTEKWEGLVRRCIQELPAREKQLESIQQRIQQERQRLMDLQKATEQLRMLETDIESAKRYFRIVERRAQQIAEATEKA